MQTAAILKDTMTRDALVLAAQAGEQAALVSLVERHQTQVYTLCLAVMRNPADAADMTQETFVRLLRVLPTFRDGSFSSWLHRITVNVCLDQLRRRRTGSVSLDAHADEPAFDVASDGGLGSARVARRVARVRGRGAWRPLRELPLPQRVALTCTTSTTTRMTRSPRSCSCR